MDEDYFLAILQKQGISASPARLNTNCDILVVGRHSWSSRDVARILHARSGLQLRVYSQELFIAYLLVGTDPLCEDEETLLRFAGDHHALSILTQMPSFRWPSTFVFPGDGIGISDSSMPKKGYLGYLGYKVGWYGIDEDVRRSILEKAYLDIVPNVFADDYIAEWGHPQSSVRLRKMAQSIAAFCKSQKRKKNSSQKAIDDWESDLAWLKQEFYDGRYHFRWPSTEVW